MKVLILSNGTIADISIIEKVYKEVDKIICADGGAKYVITSGVIPDVVIGDLDSIDNEVLCELKEKNVQFVKFPVKKDKTDTELAIDYAIENGAKEIFLMGSTGTRLDHTFANVMLLIKLLKCGVKGKIIDNNNEIYILDSEMFIDKEDDCYISVIPIFEDSVVTLEGFEYDVANESLSLSSTLGISNKVVRDKAYIKVDNGICLIFKSKD